MNELGNCPRRDQNFPFAPAMAGPDTWREDGTCSYCGSVSQEAFFKFVEAGGEVGPTDKSYKVYLHGAGEAVAPGIKFYMQHLNEDGMNRFVELINSKKMNIGYPGRFYVLPFFCVRAPITAVAES